jgi:hypothetical protein
MSAYIELLNNYNLKLIDEYENFKWNINGIDVYHRKFTISKVKYIKYTIQISQIKSDEIRKYYVN